MQGLGNDFIVIDAVRQRVSLKSDQARTLADRHFGIGCDQLLVVGAPTNPSNDFSYRIFNADGDEVEQCGNGARCFARFVLDEGLTAKRSIRVETARGVINPVVRDDGLVTVDMGAPRFAPADVPFITDAEAPSYSIDVDGRALELHVLSMGNPHAVQFVPDVATTPVATLGPKIEHHARFPQRVNAGFAQIISTHEIKLRVWERGAGETLACGSGACAAAVAGIRGGRLSGRVRVVSQGGAQDIEWAGAGSPVYMTGPAVRVFSGTIELSP